MGEGELPADPDRIVDRVGFAAELARLKAASGLSFRALARKSVPPAAGGAETGVPLLPFTTIRDYVQGRTLPSAVRLDAVLTAFGLAPDDHARRAWQDALARAAAAPVGPSADLRPYPGRQPVGERLRGREAAIADVLARLRAAPPGGVVVVTGPSGVGVTSLLRAGVLPHLADVVEHGAGPDPAGRLARALAGPAAYVLVDDVHLLLDDELPATLRVLLDGEPGGGPRVLLGIREDLLADLSAPGARPVAAVRLAGPSAEGLRAIIEEPAAGAGFPAAEGLADLMLAELDVAPTADASPAGTLPLLAEALAATWDRTVAGGGSTVTIAHYRESGGVRGAAERMAEQAFAALPAAQVRHLRRLVLRLTRPRGAVGETESVRRRLTRAAPADRGLPEIAETDAVLETGVTGRVLTGMVGTVELAHPVFLTAWPRLVDWVDDDRERFPSREMVTSATQVWVETDCDPESLLGGRRLDAALELVADPEGRQELYPVELDLVAASHERRQAGMAARRRQALVGRLSLVLGVLLGLVVVAVVVVALVVGSTS